MKRLMKSMVLMAAAAVALVSCAKENVNEANDGGQKFAEVSFKAEIPAYKTTKSTIDVDGLTFNTRWADGDQMGLMGEYGDDETAYNLCGTYSKGSFTAKFPEYTGMWYYYGYYPYQKVENAEHCVDIPFGAERVQNGNDFNSAYDIMCAEYVGVENAEQGKTDSGEDITFKMVRQTALLYFHFTTDGLDEPLTKATLTAEGDPIASDKYSMYYYGNNLNSDSYGTAWTTGDSPSITLTFTNAPSSKDFKLWFNILPCVEGLRENGIKNLKLVVETEDKTLTLKADAEEMYLPGDISKVEFTNVPASNWKDKTTPTPPATKVYYEKVTTAPTDWSGDYLIVYETGSVAFDGSLEKLDATNNGKVVTITNNQIEATEETDAISFVIDAVDGGYTIQSTSGKYIDGDSDKSKNGLSENASTKFVNTISLNQITGSRGQTLKYNKASNQSRFRYYKSGQEAIALYKRSENIDRPTVPSLTLSDGAATVAADAVTTSFDVTSNLDWTVSTDAEWVTDWTKSGSNNGTVTIKFGSNTTDAARTAEFTVKSADNTISKTFTLTQKAAGAAEPTTETYTFSSFTSATDVTFNSTNFTIKMSKNTGSASPTWNSKSSEARLYTKGSMTITSSKKIVKIEYNYVINKTPTIDSVTGQTNSGIWNAESKTWSDTKGDTEITLSTSGSSGNLGFKSITVTFAE